MGNKLVSGQSAAALFAPSTPYLFCKDECIGHPYLGGELCPVPGCTRGERTQDSTVRLGCPHVRMRFRQRRYRLCRPRFPAYSTKSDRRKASGFNACIYAFRSADVDFGGHDWQIGLSASRNPRGNRNFRAHGPVLSVFTLSEILRRNIYAISDAGKRIICRL